MRLFFLPWFYVFYILLMFIDLLKQCESNEKKTGMKEIANNGKS